MKKAIHLLITCVCIMTLFSVNQLVYAEDDEENEDIKILYTTNLNDHIEGRYEKNANGDSVYVSGYSLLKGAIDLNRDDNSILVDAGNFSFGTIYNSIYATDAPDLSMLATMGYDAVNLGPRDFSYGINTLATMVNAASASPTVVSANIDPSANKLNQALEAREASTYKIIEKGETKIGIFGVIDREDLSNNDKVYVKDPFEVVPDLVTDIKREGASIIVCLWSGDIFGAETIAKNNHDIDVIVCCEDDVKYETVTKSTIENTSIVFTKGDARELGILTVDKEGKATSISKFELSEENCNWDAATYDAEKKYRSAVSSTILRRYGLSFNTSYARIGYDTDNLKALDSGLVNCSSADLVTDSFVNAYKAREDDNSIVVSVTTRSMITGYLKEGAVSINDIFSLVNQGVGSDELVGRTLIRVYMYGKDLRNLCELDCSYLKDVTDDQLYFGSMRYDYDGRRMEWNRVEEVYVESTRGYFIPVRDDEVYPVIMNEAVYELLPRLIKRSKGNISIDYYGIDMAEIEDIDELRLHYDDGTLVKEWTAVAKYMSRYEKGKNGYQIDSEYKAARGTKNYNNRFHLIDFFKNTTSTALAKYLDLAKYVVIAFVGAKLFIWLWNIKWKKPKEES